MDVTYAETLQENEDTEDSPKLTPSTNHVEKVHEHCNEKELLTMVTLKKLKDSKGIGNG